MQGTVDILGFDVYPCQRGQACNFGMIDYAIERIRTNRVTNWWAVIQDFADSSWRWPSPAELTAEFQHWSGSGMSGYLVFAWDYQDNSVTSQAGNLDALREANGSTLAAAPTPTPMPTATPGPIPTPSSTPLAPTPTPSALAVVGSGNLVGNPGFETSTSRWNTAGHPNSLERVSGGHSGSYSARLTNNDDDDGPCVLNDSPDWVRKPSAGSYVGSVWVRGDSPGATVELSLRQWAPDGSLVGATYVNTILTTSWQQLTATYAAAGTGTLDFQVHIDDAPPGTCFYADDAFEMRT